MKPKAYDLFCGLGGWTEGLLAEDYDVTGYDIEAHEYESTCNKCDGTGNFYRNDEDGDRLNCDCYIDYDQYGKVIQKYPATLVLRDVLSIHGSEFKDAALIVASPPCQEYSYMAMPFSRGKAIAKALRGQGEFPEGYTGSRTIEQLNALFNACFRIQREASEAAGRHVPMVVENVRGAQPWVGKAKANFGSFYLWGDVPALMPYVYKCKCSNEFSADLGKYGCPNCNSENGAAIKQPGLSGAAWFDRGAAALSSKSTARKAASAQIAKIPFALSSHIARAYKPATWEAKNER